MALNACSAAAALLLLLLPSAVLAQCTDAKATLVEINKLRAKHGSPPLKWQTELARPAVAWAKTLAAQGCKLSAYSTTMYGQNLAAFYGSSDAKCVAAADLWYSGIKSYNFSKTPYTDNMNKQVGSFTQLVWRSTTAVGCGGAVNASEKCCVALCLFSPPGNAQGNAFYLENVKPVNTSFPPPSPPPKRSPPPAPKVIKAYPPPPGNRTNSPHPPPPSGSCKDTFTFCPEWKAKGYCAPQWQFDNQPVSTWCKKTCGKC